MSESTSAVLFDEIVPPRRPWGRVIRKGQILRLVDLEGQQAVDFLCYDADNPADRYPSMTPAKPGSSMALLSPDTTSNCVPSVTCSRFFRTALKCTTLATATIRRPFV